MGIEVGGSEIKKEEVLVIFTSFLSEKNENGWKRKSDERSEWKEDTKEEDESKRLSEEKSVVEVQYVRV